MPNQASLTGFFSDEWARFTGGLSNLAPGVQNAGALIELRPELYLGGTHLITIPGWDQVVHLGPRPEVPPGAWKEFYAAQREHRPANLSQETLSEIGARLGSIQAQQNSAQPPWAQSWGQIMTAIDNVQDFVSTLATFGRLFAWGAPRLLDPLLPGLSASAAELAARQAARRYAAQLALELGGRAGWNAAFIDAAASAVGRATGRRLLLGFGARAVGLLLPGIGWIVLASDLLNVINFLATAAMPLYALLCAGPADALAAGVPAAVLKNVLCRELWTMAHLNPFSRAAQAARRGKIVGKLPSIGNLIEVAQTTDQLFGVGLSIGGLYGTAMETLFAAAQAKPFENTQLNAQPFWNSFQGVYAEKIAKMDPATLAMNEQAAKVIADAPQLASKSDLLPDELHLTHMAALLGAWHQVSAFFAGTDHETFISEVAGQILYARNVEPRNAREMLPDWHRELAGIGRWAIRGTPRGAPADELVGQFTPMIARAVDDFLRPRRNTQAATFYGAALNQLTENIWNTLEGQAEGLRWHLTPEYVVLTTLAVEGVFPLKTTPLDKLWRWWDRCLELVDRRGGVMLERDDLVNAMRAEGVDYVRMLAPQAAWPEEWAPFFEHPERYLSGDPFVPFAGELVIDPARPPSA